MILNIKKIIYPFSYRLRNKYFIYKKDQKLLLRLRRNNKEIENFNITQFKEKVLQFFDSIALDKNSFQYCYSASASQPTLYSSVYACMTLSLLGELNNDQEKQKWIAYFDSFQNKEDGLFYDHVVMNENYVNSDWWGDRHLALHMISAYTALGGRPKYPFRFLSYYYSQQVIRTWLDKFNWESSFNHENDIDNKIMNIGSLLQYQRDFWNDEKAGMAVIYLQDYLQARINPETGMWGKCDIENPDQLSRKIQFAYHIFPLFFYDDVGISQVPTIVDLVLKTQNRFGGFGVKSNSSACEDIDSIDLLCSLVNYVPERKNDIDVALRNALKWVLCNQVEDGGFVFRLSESLKYGHDEMSSIENQGAMFPTWFRILSLAYLARYFDKEGFSINSAPGLEF